jgi:hypothetical protein
MKNKWLIWSNEHEQWWEPACHGYTPSRADAGRYTLNEATEICVAANRYQKDGKPLETMLPDV